jgi:DNA polymerase-3 subunit beta
VKIKGMIRRTGFAAATEEQRYILNGLFVSVKGHKVTMVATDGRRLALTEEDVDTAADAAAEFIVPTKAIGELQRLLLDKGDVELRFTANQAAFNLRAEGSPGILVVTKLVEGAYPNYRQVIPSESKERVVLAREELCHALRRAEIMTTDKNSSVKLTFARHTLIITANAQDVGEARETMAVNYQGHEFGLAFNPRFLLDALEAVDDDEVYFELTDELSPGVLKANTPYLYVIMPMRLQ